MDMAPIDALYFTVITLTTVGYDDMGLAGADGRSAQIFTIFFILGGIITASYTAAVIIGAAIKPALFARSWPRIAVGALGVAATAYGAYEAITRLAVL